MSSLSARALRSVATVAAGGLVLARSSPEVARQRRPADPGAPDPGDPGDAAAALVAEEVLHGAAGAATHAADLEVTTVTDTTVALTWTTYGGAVRTPYGPARPAVAAPETVLLGPADAGPPPVVHHDDRPRGVHHVVIGGLEPGREYRFECRSGPLRATASLAATRRPGSPELTGRFRTLDAPAGPRLARIAIANDTHIGKRVRATGVPDAAERQLAGLVADVRAAGADALVVNGDCTDANTPAQVERFRRIMNGAGRLGRDWFAVRGNHDNHPQGRPGRRRRGGAGEPIPDHFGAHFTARQRHFTGAAGPVRILGVDTSLPHLEGGHIGEAQFAAIGAELAADPERPTVVFGHHPVTSCAGASNIGGPGFILPRAQSLRLQRMLAGAPGTLAMFAGHTHRTRRGGADIGGVDYCERGAAFGHPAGWTMLDIRTGGYLVSFHRTTDPGCLELSARARWSVFGMGPEYLLGGLADRNYLVRRPIG